LHGYRKKSMKAPVTELATALRRMEEILSEV
jgi:phage-related protein